MISLCPTSVWKDPLSLVVYIMYLLFSRSRETETDEGMGSSLLLLSALLSGNNNQLQEQGRACES